MTLSGLPAHPLASVELEQYSTPGDIAARWLLELVLAGDLDAAQDLAATGGSASPEDLYNLGEVAFGEGNVDAAADWYEKAVAADPDWEPPVFKLALVALNRGDIEGAKVLFQKVIDLAPNSPEGAQAEATLAALP